MIEVIEALSTRANVHRVNFLPLLIVVELIHGDGRDYPRRSLPGIVAGVTTTHHHGLLPFFDDMKYHNRERLPDPAPYLRGPLIDLLPKNETRRLLEAEELVMNSYFDVEGMSKGLITLTFRGSAMEQPKIPAGHPPVPILEWQRYSLYQILNASGSSELLDGLRGAPILGVDNGDMAGYIDLIGGDYAQSAALDDLIAEGWIVV